MQEDHFKNVSLFYHSKIDVPSDQLKKKKKDHLNIYERITEIQYAFLFFKYDKKEVRKERGFLHILKGIYIKSTTTSIFRVNSWLLKSETDKYACSQHFCSPLY